MVNGFETGCLVLLCLFQCHSAIVFPNRTNSSASPAVSVRTRPFVVTAQLNGKGSRVRCIFYRACPVAIRVSVQSIVRQADFDRGKIIHVKERTGAPTQLPSSFSKGYWEALNSRECCAKGKVGRDPSVSQKSKQGARNQLFFWELVSLLISGNAQGVNSCGQKRWKTD